MRNAPGQTDTTFFWTKKGTHSLNLPEGTNNQELVSDSGFQQLDNFQKGDDILRESGADLPRL